MTRIKLILVLALILLGGLWAFGNARYTAGEQACQRAAQDARKTHIEKDKARDSQVDRLPDDSLLDAAREWLRQD